MYIYLYIYVVMHLIKTLWFQAQQETKREGQWSYWDGQPGDDEGTQSRYEYINPKIQNMFDGLNNIYIHTYIMYIYICMYVYIYILGQEFDY